MYKTYEIVTFRLKPETEEAVYIEETKKLEREFLGKLPGFIDRETGVSEDGEWTVVLHWRSAEDAQASINKFVESEGTKSFTELIDMDTFEMKRFEMKDRYNLKDQ